MFFYLDIFESYYGAHMTSYMCLNDDDYISFSRGLEVIQGPVHFFPRRRKLLLLGGALVKWPKYFFLPIAMKLAGNREWPADYLTSRLKFFLAEGPCFSRNMLKKSILPVKWGVMLNDQDVKVHYLNYGHQDNYW